MYVEIAAFDPGAERNNVITDTTSIYTLYKGAC